MPWITGMQLNLFGSKYARGVAVPQAVIDQIPPGRLGSMERLSMLRQVTPGQAELLSRDSEPVEAEGENCPHCGAGPFKRLAQHISQMHEGDA